MQAASDRTALIGRNRGTTSFRADRMDTGGRILDRLASDAGILSVAKGDFAAALRDRIGGWPDRARRSRNDGPGLLGGDTA